MILNEKETNAIKDLQTQEKTCVQKYKKYAQEAKDPVLKELFTTIQREEQKHVESLGQVLIGAVPSADCNCDSGKNYHPVATYSGTCNENDKQADCFLVTDCIGTEKLVSGEYNSDVFVMADTSVRKLLADIQIEEQNHAEMLYKYKTVNHMS